MRLLLLTCNTGEGHNSATGAIEEIAELHGAVCERADALAFLSKTVSRLICAIFTRLYRSMAGLWQKSYAKYEEELANDSESRSLAARLIGTGAIRLRRYLRENDFDGVLCTHAFAAIMLSRALEKEPLDIPCALLFTDYTIYPFSPEQELANCCIAHEDLIDLFTSCGIARERLRVTGIPVRRVFRNPVPREIARKSLGVPEDATNVVLMCGSMGCGPMEELARALADTLPENGLLTVCCGTNKKLLSTLERANLKNVRPLGFTRDVPLWMSSADLFVTKPGGLSVTEAANHGTPLLLMNIVGGCETPNFRLFLEKGFAEGVEDAKDAPALCRDLLADSERREAMVRRQKVAFAEDAALKIWRIFDPNA